MSKYICVRNIRGKTVRGGAERYFLPVYNGRTINLEYHNQLSFQINPTTTETVTKETNISNRLVTISNCCLVTIAKMIFILAMVI